MRFACRCADLRARDTRPATAGVRQPLLEHGQSQTELADALGITFQQIQKYENGTNRLSAGRAYTAAQHLGVTLDYFFEGAELPAASQPNPDLLFENDKQVIALVRSFVQISDADTRSAVTSFVNSVAKAEPPQAKPRKRPGAKRRS